MIYYFSEYQLPFDFVLAYEDTKEFDEEYELFKQETGELKVIQVKEDLWEEIELTV